MAYTRSYATWQDFPNVTTPITAAKLQNMEDGIVNAGAQTTSALSGGPPSSPQDKDIWIATAVDSNGTRWQFQYNAGSASAYKWEFIGGPPLRVGFANVNTVINAATQVAATGYYYAAGNMNYSTVRAGDYLLTGTVDIFLNGGTTPVGAVAAIFQGATITATLNTGSIYAGGSDIAGVIDYTLTGVAASTTIGVAATAGAVGTNKLAFVGLKVLPVRIS